MTIFFTALALAVVIEGLLYAAFPQLMKRALLMVLEAPVSTIRAIALTSAAIGLMILYVLQAL
ncbi:MAG: DUF2065 domain-containing protein [Alphaproteobacteria bacterium]|nr:DUF2065 domain-containing protein [Alphaproteobacteria bacterium]